MEFEKTNAVEIIKSTISMEDVLNYYQITTISNRCQCPIHNGDNKTSFSFSPQKNLFYCHTGCGGGDIIRFVQLKEDLSFEESVHFLANLFRVDINNMAIMKQTNFHIKDINEWMDVIRSINKPIQYKSFDINSLGTLYPIVKYRNFNKDILNQFGIKYCQQNKRIVVPIHIEDVCVGVIQRRTDNHPAKWLNSPSGLLTSNMLYNLNRIDKGQKIILVEGAFDVLNCNQMGFKNTVGTFGAHLTDSQLSLILKHTYDVMIAYDADKAGIQATKTAISKLINKVNISIAKIPNGKDAGELTLEEMTQSFTNTYSVQEWRNIYNGNN